MHNVPGREHTRTLNGRWRTIVDPYETGYLFFNAPNPNGFFRNFKPRSPSDRVEYDFDESPLLNVPGDWNTQAPELHYYEGTVWYKRDFDWQPRKGRRLFVHLDGANYHTRAWLNGQELGEHEGGFTAFGFELTEHAKPGHNFLILKVDNERVPDGVPTTDTDWWNYGGLTRDVTLIETPQTFVRDYRIDLDAGWVQLDGPDAANRAVRVRVGDWSTDRSTDANGRATFEIGFDPEPWSPENPLRHDVEITQGDETVRDRIGFRRIATRGQDILLNGEPIFLRGISIHEEAPLSGGRACTEDDARTLLRWAKELGCNFVRLAHYPHNEHMVRVADEIGLLVWSEIPVYWTIQFGNPKTIANARSQLEEMIVRDRNRACVIVWSMGNETPPGDERTAFLAGLAERARELDPTRLISAALLCLPNAERKLHLDDALGQHLDVLACNEYVGWYYGNADEIHTWSWSSAYDKPLIMSELGGGALAGHHGGRDEIWTEEFQAHVYEKQIEMLRGIPFLRGITPWILQDFRSPKRVLPGIQDGYNRKGLISERGQRKLAFGVMQRFYRELGGSGKTAFRLSERPARRSR